MFGLLFFSAKFTQNIKISRVIISRRNYLIHCPNNLIAEPVNLNLIASRTVWSMHVYIPLHKPMVHSF